MMARKRRPDGPREPMVGLNGDGGRSLQESIGWGLDGEEEQERAFLRRVLFSVLVAAVACVGVWFLLATAGGAPGRSRPLSANTAAGPYTLKLLEFPASKEKEAALLMSQEPIKALAGGAELFLEDLPTGRKAICVGHFDSRDDGALQELLRRFRGFALQQGRPFEGASVYKRSQ